MNFASKPITSPSPLSPCLCCHRQPIESLSAAMLVCEKDRLGEKARIKECYEEWIRRDILDFNRSGRTKEHMLGCDRCKCQLDCLIWIVMNGEYLCQCFSLKIFACVSVRGSQQSLSRYEQPKDVLNPVCTFSFNSAQYVSASTMHLYLHSFAHSCKHVVLGKVKRRRGSTPCNSSQSSLLPPHLLKEFWHPAGKDERLDYSQISKWAG